MAKAKLLPVIEIPRIPYNGCDCPDCRADRAEGNAMAGLIEALMERNQARKGGK